MSEHPPDWEETTLGSVFNQRKEAGFPNEELLAVTSSMGVVRRDSLERRDTSNEDKSKYLLVQKGDIAYNTMRMWQGVSGVSRFRGIVSPAYTICTPTEGLDARFAGYLLKDPEMVSVFRQRSQGLVSDTWNLKYESFAQIPCTIPPLPEQKKIAEILSGIDQQIANQQNKARKWLYLHQGILDLLMTQGTTGRAVVDTDAGKVPDNWNIGRVEDFFTLGRGRVISIPYIKDHPGPYPVFSSQSKNNGEMGRMDTYDFDGDYFTWTTDGAYAGSVFARSGKFNCTNVCGTGRAKSPGEADTKFAAYFLQRVAKGHVSYVGNPKLMNNTFAEIPFALPPIDEQGEINAIIDSARRNIDIIENQIASLSNLKKSISTDLLSGRKRVSV